MKFAISDIVYELGENKLDTSELISRLNLSVAKKVELLDKIGTQNIFQANPDSDFLSLSTKCINSLMKNNKISEEGLGILFVTQSNSQIIPAEGQRVRHACQLSDSVFVLDLNIGCSGFVYALFLAGSLINSKGLKNIIIVCGDTYRKYLDPADRSTNLLFSDAVSAVLIDSKSSSEILGFNFGGDGFNYEDISMEKPTINSNPTYFKMNGAKVFSYTNNVIPKSINKVLLDSKKDFKDISLFYFHQASGVVLESLKTKLNINEEQMPTSLSKFGNTGSASIPITLSNSILKNSIKNGDHLIFSGFGIGLSYGTILLKW